MKRLTLFLVVIGMVIFASCSASETTERNEDDSIQNVVEDNEVVETSDIHIIEIDAFSFGYSLEEIRINKGEKVKIIMTNTGGRHDFVIDELAVKTPVIGTGETIEVEFIATEIGEFYYYCSVGNHRAAGMEGKLIVE